MSFRAFIRALDGLFYYFGAMVKATRADLYDAHSIRTSREGKLMEIGIIFSNPELMRDYEEDQKINRERLEGAGQEDEA